MQPRRGSATLALRDIVGRPGRHSATRGTAGGERQTKRNRDEARHQQISVRRNKKTDQDYLFIVCGQLEFAARTHKREAPWDPVFSLALRALCLYGIAKSQNLAKASRVWLCAFDADARKSCLAWAASGKACEAPSSCKASAGAPFKGNQPRSLPAIKHTGCP